MHTNENVAIGLFKETMLKILLEPEEKKRALSAIMAHYEKSRLFTFTDEQAQRAAVFRLDVAQLTCKEHL